MSATWYPSDYQLPETTNVLFDAPGEAIAAGAIAAIDPTITYPVTKFVGLKRNERVDVNAVTYYVRHVYPIEDGQIMRAELMIARDE